MMGRGRATAHTGRKQSSKRRTGIVYQMSLGVDE